MLNAITGEPVTKAAVTLQGSVSGTQFNSETMAKTVTYSASANIAGEFEFKDIEPGSYRLSASRRGFVDGSRRGFSPLVKVAPARDVRAIKLTLTPQAIMSGRVTDSDSEPFQGVQLEAIRRQYMQGNLLAVPAGTATTNDLGEYRISDLAPGRYLLMAVDRQAEHSNLGLGRKVSKDPAQETYLPMFYPGVGRINQRDRDRSHRRSRPPGHRHRAPQVNRPARPWAHHQRRRTASIPDLSQPGSIRG